MTCNRYKHFKACWSCLKNLSLSLGCHIFIFILVTYVADKFTIGGNYVIVLICRLRKLQRHMGLSAHLTFTCLRRCTPFAWHVLSTKGSLHGVWHMSLGRFWILFPSELFGTLTSEDPTEDIPWNIRVRICRNILLRFLCFLAPSSAFECQYIVFLCLSTGREETIWACIP